MVLGFTKLAFKNFHAVSDVNGCPADRCDQIVALERKRQLLSKTAYCDSRREGETSIYTQRGDDTVKITNMVAAILAVSAALSAAPAMAWDQDFFGSYFQRSDNVTLSAGDAKSVNEATHVIDPWPRYVGQRKIRSNGERMAGVAERYRGNKAAPPPTGFGQGGISPSTAPALGGIGAGAAAAAGK
jgi:hypothetical protein